MRAFKRLVVDPAASRYREITKDLKLSSSSSTIDLRTIWHPLSVQDSQIRLLTVEPSIDNQEVLSCSLSVVSLDQKPEFAALSYTWGDPTVTVPILLNGHVWQVTTGLREALQHLRHSSDRFVIFADALCINQQDLDEKSTQVVLMSRVYGQAKLAHCWLGPPVDDMERVYEIFMQIGRGTMMTDMSPDLVDDNSIRSLIAFLKKPYWKRAWIIQEVMLAQRALFHCGKYQFSREDLPQGGFLSASLFSMPRDHPKLKGTNLKSDLMETSRLNIAGLLVATTLGREHILQSSLGVMILDLARQEATVQHDHIYAILAMLPPELRARIKPDYRDTVANVFANFAYEFVRFRENTSSLLEAAIAMDKNPLGLPSWTPAFTQDEDGDWRPVATNFMANSQISSKITLLDKSFLGINAYCLDDIVSTQPLTRDDGILIMLLDEPERSVPLHREWRQLLGLGDDYCGDREYIGGGCLEDAYWRLLCREKVGHNSEDSTWITQSEVETMARWYQHSRYHDPLLNIDEKTKRCITAFSDELSLFKRRVGYTKEPSSSTYHLFKTAKGYIGMTDREHEPRIGDSVYLIAATAAPTILRLGQSLPSSEPAYSIVSQAYVAGLMLKTVLSRQVTPEMPAIDYSKIVHPHI